MSYASHLLQQYMGRTGQPGDMGLDAAYQYQLSVLRDMLSRLEVILDDEGVDRPTAQRVLRCLIYGAPGVADAELRIQQQKEITDLLSRLPPEPVNPWKE